MWNAVSAVDDVGGDQHLVLSEDVAAIELDRIENGHARLGPVSRIPEGAEIHICGDGFNGETVKVRWEDQYYFVFFEDLRAQRKPSVRSASC